MAEKVYYDWQWVNTQVDNIGEKLEYSPLPKFVTGIPRGGLIPAILISHKFGIPYIGLEAAKALPGGLKKDVLVVDDIEINNDNWLVFPWEDFNAEAVQGYLAK